MNPLNTTALILIDLQKAILERLGGDRQMDHEKAMEATTGRISGLLGRARIAGIPVIHVQHDGAAGHRLTPNSEGWQIRAEVAPSSGELVIHKRACDAFFETELESELSRRNLDRIVVAGCMTQYCVDTTVRRAVSLGFDVVLAADGHMTADSGDLRFERIIAHHNKLLDGFDAGSHSVAVMPVAKIEI